MDYYKIAKTGYCIEGDQFDCRDCELYDYFEKHNCNSIECKTHLIVGLVKEIERLRELNE